MTFLEMASLVTIFGFIVGIFSVWNGRMTRKQISTDIAELSKIQERMGKRMAEDHKRMVEILERLFKK